MEVRLIIPSHIIGHNFADLWYPRQIVFVNEC